MLASALVTLIVKDDSIVWMGHFDRSGIRRRTLETMEEIARLWRQVIPYFYDRDELPIVGQASFECAERIRDSSPFLHGGIPRIPAVNHVPDKTSDHTDTLSRSA